MAPAPLYQMNVVPCGAASASLNKTNINQQEATVARLFHTFPAKVAGKFEKIRPPQKNLCKATFQTHFVH
jgi:hypothetical protein